MQIETPKSNDEISRLTRSFNNMLGKLNRSFENQRLFAQNAAHELKTPLASIMANIEVLQLDGEPPADEYKEVIDIVKSDTHQLIELVEGLLSINNMIDEAIWQSFGGKDIFQKIINELKDDIEQKRIRVAITGDCRIKSDKPLLERAFLNLVLNAVRYNVDKGTVNISLSEGSIIIEDSGIGMSDENLGHIFEPFHCADKSRSKKLGGHGLGMSIVKNIFDKHNMEVIISSKLGEGTKIIINY
ncbi:MAG: HAMP domain-containing histidine kinase [Defluviitaleaceae bacterium]|nr:HAMP domain-containing histidine kinase [Defluviitaleaceae bacterium]